MMVHRVKNKVSLAGYAWTQGVHRKADQTQLTRANTNYRNKNSKHKKGAMAGEPRSLDKNKIEHFFR
jgi:hypothetical protein